MQNNILGLTIKLGLLAFYCVTISCSPTTGTSVWAHRGTLTRFQQLGLLVTKEEEFSVRITREQEPNPGAVLLGVAGIAGGLVGAVVGLAAATGIDSTIGAHSDSQFTDKVAHHIIGIDPVKIMREGLITEFRREQMFPSVVLLSAGDKSSAQSAGADGMLHVKVKQWGLRLCSPSGPNHKVQAAILYESRMMIVESSELLWQRQELYLDGECYQLDELSAKGNLLPTMLSQAIQSATGKLAYEIRFP